MTDADESTTPTDAAREPSAGRGSRILAVTGLTLVVLTIAGAVLRWQFSDALWSQVFFAASISGLVGFATNWVAIRMLFHPRVKFLGVQGVVPSRRRELAQSVGKALEEHLISADRMHRLLLDTGAVDRTLDSLMIRLPAILDDPHTRSLAENEVRRTIESSLGSVVAGAKGSVKKKLRSNITALLSGASATAAFGPMAGLLAAGAMRSGLLDGIVDRLIDDMVAELAESGKLDSTAREVVQRFPEAASDILSDRKIRERLVELVSGISESLVGSIDVAGLVEQELLAHDDAELEELIDRVASNELCFIQVAGGGLGMIAGLALIWPWLLIPMGATFLLAWQFGRMAETRYERQRAEQAATPRREPEGGSAVEPGSACAAETAASGGEIVVSTEIIEAEFVHVESSDSAGPK